MKRNLQIIICASAASLLALSTLAQKTSNSTMDETQSSPQPMAQGRTDHLKDTAKASDIIGMAVKNYQGEKLGKVADLTVDVESGRIVQVIISTGGFLGIDKTLTPVPPEALQHEAGQKILQLDASTEKFNAAPKCETAKGGEDTQSNQVIEVYSYYGQQPYFAREGNESTNTDAAFANSLPRNTDGTINTAGGRSVETVHNVEVARNVEENNNNISTRNPDGSWTRTYYSTNSSCSKLGYVEKASKLMSESVKNLQDEKLGKVKNFIVDLSAGRIVAVIISSGGYLAMDGELSAVPPTALKFNTEHDSLQLDTSKEMLASSPHFQADQWPDFNQPGYAAGVYDAYKVEPYFNTDVNAEPDNTARNVRDRDSSALTPLDQGNSQADIDTTAEIRKEILAGDGMSMNAKNVKIITMNGHVTLRGPVNSADEKRQIGDIANRVAQTSNVDNQLEVTQNTSSLN
jgi:sporulation protein YlmC with PRC-barrel domain